jgi:hypothetical protein
MYPNDAALCDDIIIITCCYRILVQTTYLRRSGYPSSGSSSLEVGWLVWDDDLLLSLSRMTTTIRSRPRIPEKAAASDLVLLFG